LGNCHGARTADVPLYFFSHLHPVDLACQVVRRASQRVRSGAWCVRCCSALIASLFALAVMNPIWMGIVLDGHCRRLIATEKTSSVAPSSDLRHGDHPPGARLACARRTAGPSRPHRSQAPTPCDASLVLMHIRVSIRDRRRTVCPSRSSGGSAFRKGVRLRPLISFEGSGDLCPARNGRVDTALPAIPLAMSGLGLLPCVC
jgi:hypothetical protein